MAASAVADKTWQPYSFMHAPAWYHATDKSPGDTGRTPYVAQESKAQTPEWKTQNPEPRTRDPEPGDPEPGAAAVPV